MSLTSSSMSRANTTTMAVAQPKPKPASKASSTQQNKLKAQMHRRSRTGCYTCRLRRKKCDEGSPCCSACKNLGLECNYKRPMWWSNGDSRRLQKDGIKMIIKRKKLSEKASQILPPGADTPPGLSHSLPTSATYSDSIDRTRSGSADSTFSLDFNFDVAPAIADYSAYNAHMHSSHAQFVPPLYSEFPPYDVVGVKTEREVFMDDSLTRRESTVSTFSTFHTPQEYHPSQDASLSSYKGEGEYFDDMYFERRASMPEELTENFFESPDVISAASHPLLPDLEQSDESLLGHFIQNVLPSIFPVLEANVSAPTLSDLILPALETNKSYLHCALNISAQHYKSTAATHDNSDAIDADIMRHRQAGIRELCSSIGRNEPTNQILDTTLGMIFLQCAVGRADEALPDVPWHQHFHAASDLVQKLDLPAQVAPMDGNPGAAPFNMTLMAWIDILGAALVGRSPTFADTYRMKHFSATNSSLGLRELTGCDDRVMFLISEIACLEGLQLAGMEVGELCSYIQSLGEHITQTENGMSLKSPLDHNGALNSDQLSNNITAAFRIAARIYLCSLVPGFSPAQESCVRLVENLARVLAYIPAGAHGFDRSLVWVYLMGGAVSTAGSSFRALFDARVADLGEAAGCGSFGRVACLLREVWAQADARPERVVSWRDVMQSKGWDFLLI
ncbi:hypothetical protein V496_10359 [Pseudogymnoascus sp. VKM F-4515 (FW-2607)]|nr:hypothetical protein V496_10359 [Pseudogymnoascus sp. VKM F-4515 (FW-2607)]